MILQLQIFSVLQTLRNTLLYIAKNAASGAFGLIFIYTSELFPTSVRGTGIGLCSLMARVGALATPFMGDLAEVTSEKVPYFLLGGFAIVSGLLCFLLPETLGSTLPENIDDIEVLEKNSKSLCTCVNPNKK